MLILRVVSGLTLATMVAVGLSCTKRSQSSNTKDLVTDQGVAGGPTYYYFVDMPSIYRTTCPVDVPMLKENCTQDVRKADYPSFKVKIGADIDASILSLTTSINSMRDQSKAIAQQLADLDKKIAGLNTELSDLDASLADKKALIAKKEMGIAQLQSEIDQVTATIQANPNDVDSVALKTQLLADQNALKVIRDTLKSEVSAAETLANAPAKRADKTASEASRPGIDASLNKVKADLDIARAKRDLANEEKGLLGETLTKLEATGIGHRILNANSINGDLKPFAARFATFFSGSSATLPTPVATMVSVNPTPVAQQGICTVKSGSSLFFQYAALSQSSVQCFFGSNAANVAGFSSFSGAATFDSVKGRWSCSVFPSIDPMYVINMRVDGVNHVVSSGVAQANPCL